MKTLNRTLLMRGRYFFVFCLFSVFWAVSFAEAKIYIDITSPGIRKLPVSIHTSGTPASREIESIVRGDLEFTGLFTFVDQGIPGAEMIAKIDIDTSEGLKVILSVNDLIEGREVLKKRFSASNIRPLAHTISNDIYYVATGKEGIFRTKFSYLVNTSAGRKELHIMDWDGFNSMRVVSRGLTTSPNWARDGRFLVYSSERGRKWNIYLLDLRQYKEKVLFSAKGLNLAGGTSADDMISFSSSKDGSSAIYSINASGSELKKLTSSFGIDISPVFSPDSRKIAFVSDRGGTPQIYIMEADGSGLKRLTFEGTYNTSPSWSPDGKWIAYVGRTSGKNQIFMLKSDGTDIRQLTFSGNNENPTFSPDGLFMAYDSDAEGTRGIYIRRLNAEEHKRITPKKINAVSPKWSPHFK